METLGNRTNLNYVRSVRALLTEYFGVIERKNPETTGIWKDWVNYYSAGERNNESLQLLQNNQVNDAFKARALACLLSFGFYNWYPFQWPKGEFDYPDTYEIVEIGDKTFARLSPDLLRFTARLLSLNLAELRKFNIGQEARKIEKHDADRRRITINVLESIRTKTLDRYNKAILVILSLLSVNDAESKILFAHWEPNDPTVFNHTIHSGYNPFGALLLSSVSVRHKREADRLMRDIIKRELTGDKTPRENYEDALGCYIMQIAHAKSHGGYRKKDLQLFADQLEFLLSLPEETTKGKWFSTWSIWWIQEELGKTDRECLRRRVIMKTVLSETEADASLAKVTIGDHYGDSLARLLLDLLGNKETLLKQKILVGLETYYNLIQRQQGKEILSASKEKALVTAMT